MILFKGLRQDNSNSEAFLAHIKKYFSDGGDKDQKNEDGNTVLMIAIRNSINTTIDGYNIDAIKYLLNKRPDISAKDNDGDSAIFYGNFLCF